MPRFLTLFLTFAFVTIGQIGLAQDAKPVTAEIQRTLSKIESAISENYKNDEALVLLRLDLEALAKSLIDFGVSFRPELATINRRLAELGPSPKEGEPAEPETVLAERKNTLTRKAAINSELGTAEQLSIRASQAKNRISDLRRGLFARTLLKRTNSAGVFSLETWSSFTAEAGKAKRAIVSRLQFVWKFRQNSILAASALSLLLAVMVSIGFKRSFGRLFFSYRQLANLSYLGRLSHAFWSTIIPAMTVSAGLATTYAIFVYFSIFTGQSLQIFRAALVAIAALYFIQRLIGTVFAPRHPDRRLAQFSNPASRLLVWLTLLMAGVHILDFFLGALSDILSSPLPITVAQSMIAALLIGLLLIFASVVKPFHDPVSRQSLPWPAVIRLPMLLLAGFVIVAAASGYIGLARFSASQIVITGAILATMFIGIQSGRAVGADGALDITPLGKRLQERYQFSETAIDQLGLLLSLLVFLVVALVGLPLIALQWGFNWVDVSSFLYRMFTNITIGSFSVSLFAILFGIALFVAGYVITRQFQVWLDRNVMARSRIDSGVRNSIRTITGYIGIGLAALIAVSAAGFDLSNLAIVAGALSLGIGFGLQNIVNNFVSGLILLAERPFKVGDWIVAGQTAGTVKRISVRATEIETFQKQTVILPNSELINQPVGNWTHRNHLGRVDVAASAAYGTNPRMVHDLLLEIATKDPSVLKSPPPFVVFLGFGESALNFELRFHVKDVLEGSVIATRIRFAIVEAFEAQGVQIPFMQRDLNIKAADFENLIQRLQPAAKPPGNSAKRRNKPAAS